jgi:hypothetical protein
VAGEAAKNPECGGSNPTWHGHRREPLPGVLSTLGDELGRQPIRGKKSGAQTTELKTRDQGFTIAAQRRATCKCRERAEAKNGRSESETWKLSDHPPNLGTDCTRGYIPTYGRTGPEPAKIDTLGR